MRRRIQHKKRGIVLVAACLCLLLMMAGLGLGIDLNRLLIAQQSLRAHAEATAIAATLELDGTPAGLERARVRAADTWRRQTPPANSTFDIEFGPSASEVRVRASSTMPLTLLRNVVREKSLPVDVSVRAAQKPVDAAESTVLPFSVQPDGRLVGADRQTLLDILRSDSDPVSAAYAEYRGNGRRLVPLPIVDSERRVTGFAAFLLLPHDLSRAERVGGYLQGSPHRAPAESGVWRAEVVR